MKTLILTALFALTALSGAAQVYTVPGAQVQPAWVFPLWCEDGSGAKDTLYFGYDFDAIGGGFCPCDSLYGEKVWQKKAGAFNVYYATPYNSQDSLAKVNIQDYIEDGVTILFSNTILPLTLRWDPNLFYSDSLPFPDLDPAPRAQGLFWYDLPMQTDGPCSYSVPVLLTDTVIYPDFNCVRRDSILFYGNGVSYLVFSVHPWTGMWLGVSEIDQYSAWDFLPNPANDIIQLETDELPAQADIFSIAGKQLW